LALKPNHVTGKCKGVGFATVLFIQDETYEQQQLTILEVTPDQLELLVPWHIMQPMPSTNQTN